MSPPCPECKKGLIPDQPLGTSHSMGTRHRHRLPPELADKLIEAKQRLGGVTYRQLGQIMGRDHGFLVHLFHGERAPSTITAQWLVTLLPLDDDAATELLRLAVKKRDYRKYGS